MLNFAIYSLLVSSGDKISLLEALMLQGVFKLERKTIFLTLFS